MKHLLLRNNELSGVLRISKDLYPSIETLELSKNAISGVLPFDPPPTLQGLLLNDMALSGSLGLVAHGATSLYVFRCVYIMLPPPT